MTASRNFFVFFSIVTLFIGFSSCSDDDSDGEVKSKIYLPSKTQTTHYDPSTTAFIIEETKYYYNSENQLSEKVYSRKRLNSQTPEQLTQYKYNYTSGECSSFTSDTKATIAQKTSTSIESEGNKYNLTISFDGYLDHRKAITLDEKKRTIESYHEGNFGSAESPIWLNMNLDTYTYDADNLIQKQNMQYYTGKLEGTRYTHTYTYDDKNNMNIGIKTSSWLFTNNSKNNIKKEIILTEHIDKNGNPITTDFPSKEVRDYTYIYNEDGYPEEQHMYIAGKLTTKKTIEYIIR